MHNFLELQYVSNSLDEKNIVCPSIQRFSQMGEKYFSCEMQCLYYISKLR